MGKTYNQEEVVIVVRGGVAEVLKMSDNIRVLIKDYDVEGVEEDRLVRDENGDEYMESSY
jgi:hypothetical protein